MKPGFPVDPDFLIKYWLKMVWFGYFVMFLNWQGVQRFDRRSGHLETLYGYFIDQTVACVLKIALIVNMSGCLKNWANDSRFKQHYNDQIGKYAFYLCRVTLRTMLAIANFWHTVFWTVLGTFLWVSGGKNVENVKFWHIWILTS